MCSWHTCATRGKVPLHVFAGTPLKPPMHALHAYDMEAPNPRSTLSEALRTVLLHKRQLQEAKVLEERAQEKSDLLLSQRQPGRAGGAAVASGPTARVRAMFGMAPALDTSGGDSAERDSGCGGHGSIDCGDRGPGGSTTHSNGPRKSGGRPSEVRGAAGSAQAMLQAARAPKAVSAGNWLTALGSKSKKAKHRRVLEVDGEALRLPEGVSASQTTGKLHFPVTFKFHEVRCRRAHLRPLPCCAESRRCCFANSLCRGACGVPVELSVCSRCRHQAYALWLT